MESVIKGKRSDSYIAQRTQLPDQHALQLSEADPSLYDCVQCVASLPKKFEDRLIVMSCDEDIGQCRAAVDYGIPVVTSEFLLTGILQQKLDVDAYPLQPSFSQIQQHSTISLPAYCKSYFSRNPVI